MRRGLYRHARFQGPFRGPNLLPDGDMEDIGVAAWIASTATLAKDLASPYQGLRSMKIIAIGANPYAGQSVLSIGSKYRITGAAKSNGVVAPLIYNVGATPSASIWTGDLSAGWQEFDEIFTAGDAIIRLYVNGAPTNHNHYDGVYISLED